MPERIQPNLENGAKETSGMEKESSLAEKRDFLYEKIDAKIDVVLEIMELGVNHTDYEKK